jgi:hypothetical protein
VEPIGDDNLRRWINRVMDVIARIDRGETLADFAKELGVSEKDLAGMFEPERPRFLAHQLIGGRTPVSTLRAIEVVEAAIGPVQVALLARQSVPALVSVEAAWTLLRHEPTGSRSVFVLNAALASTSELYVMRAGCGARSFRHGAVSSSATGISLVDELEHECEAALARMLHIRESLPLAEKRRRLASYRPGRDAPVQAGFLTIEALHGQPDGVAEVIRRLRDRYPWLTVIVLTGPKVPDRTDGWALDDVVVVLPPLGDGEEEQIDEVLLALEEMTGHELTAHR